MDVKEFEFIMDMRKRIKKCWQDMNQASFSMIDWDIFTENDLKYACFVFEWILVNLMTQKAKETWMEYKEVLDMSREADKYFTNFLKKYVNFDRTKSNITVKDWKVYS